MSKFEIRLPPLPSELSCAITPKWDTENLRHRNCPTCMADSPAPVCTRPDNLLVCQCQKCNMLYLAIIPSKNDLQRLYQDYGTFKGYASLINKPKKMSWLCKAKRSYADIFIAIIESYGSLLKNNFCEIGASYGDFLQLAQHCGAKVSAVELDENARFFLGDVLGIPNHKRISELSADQDVIFAKSIFEHLENPTEIVTEIYAKLRTDGMLLVSLPNGANYDAVGPSWAGFRLDFEHLNYWSPKTLSDFLVRHGFYVEQYWEVNQLATARGPRRKKLAIHRLANWLLPKKFLNPCVSGKATLIMLARKIGPQAAASPY